MQSIASRLDRPLLRGVSHKVAFFVSVGAGLVLVAMAGGAVSTAAAAVYATALSLMLGVSASYHRGAWSARGRQWWRRADHAAIFLFIAGSYTPLCVLGLGGGGTRLLVLVWVGAILGALRALLWVQAPRWVTTGLYVALGWLVVVYLPAIAAAMGPLVFVPVVLGGLLYTLGAAVYALRWPEPAPRVFGYHEVFHALVIAAVVCHFVAVLQVVRATR